MLPGQAAGLKNVAAVLIKLNTQPAVSSAGVEHTPTLTFQGPSPCLPATFHIPPACSSVKFREVETEDADKKTCVLLALTSRFKQCSAQSMISQGSHHPVSHCAACPPPGRADFFTPGRLQLMPFASFRASYRVVSTSLVSIALLLFVVAVAATLQKNQQHGNTPHLVHAGDEAGAAAMYRAHEVGTEEGSAGSARLKKFVLQESTGSGSASERPWRDLSVKEVAGLCKSRGEFVEAFTSSIKEIGFEAVFFESVPVTRSTMVRGEGMHAIDMCENLRVVQPPTERGMHFARRWDLGFPNQALTNCSLKIYDSISTPEYTFTKLRLADRARPHSMIPCSTTHYSKGRETCALEVKSRFEYTQIAGKRRKYFEVKLFLGCPVLTIADAA